MTTMDKTYWEQLWEKTLREHGDKVSRKPPNAQLIEIAGALPPARALDAGCGHGAESLWLATHGWQVTAVDFAAAALAQGRSMAASIGVEVEWIEADLGAWAPPSTYDLVTALYVHIAGSVSDMIGKLAAAVAPGGTLFLLGHRPVDPATGEPTRAANQRQVSVEEAIAMLDGWELVIAEERRRSSGPSGVDAVIHARRR
jgi:SAM-dependent methyltransferase